MGEEDPAFPEVLGLGVLVCNKTVGRGLERNLAHPFSLLLLFVCLTDAQPQSATTLELQVTRSMAL